MATTSPRYHRFHCPACGKTVTRYTSLRSYPSYCTETGREVRMRPLSRKKKLLTLKVSLFDKQRKGV